MTFRDGKCIISIYNFITADSHSANIQPESCKQGNLKAAKWFLFYYFSEVQDAGYKADVQIRN